MEYLNRLDADLADFDPDIILWAKRTYASLVGGLHWPPLEAYGKALGEAQSLEYARRNGKQIVWEWGGYAITGG